VRHTASGGGAPAVRRGVHRRRLRDDWPRAAAIFGHHRGCSRPCGFVLQLAVGKGAGRLSRRFRRALDGNIRLCRVGAGLRGRDTTRRRRHLRRRVQRRVGCDGCRHAAAKALRRQLMWPARRAHFRLRRRHRGCLLRCALLHRPRNRAGVLVSDAQYQTGRRQALQRCSGCGCRPCVRHVTTGVRHSRFRHAY
jgi:hypothetical protein